VPLHSYGCCLIVRFEVFAKERIYTPQYLKVQNVPQRKHIVSSNQLMQCREAIKIYPQNDMKRMKRIRGRNAEFYLLTPWS
jgi:hypothetical protein